MPAQAALFMHASTDSPDTIQPWQVPAALPFKLLHMQRAPDLDLVDKLAFDVFVELTGLIELGAPCLFYLTAHEARSGFALPEYAPRSHHNGLMMQVVDQDRSYEELTAFEARIHARARRMLDAAHPAPVADPDALEWDAGDLPVAQASLEEPPSWALEAIPLDDSLCLQESETGAPDYV